jgi:hypothetical protein
MNKKSSLLISISLLIFVGLLSACASPIPTQQAPTSTDPTPTMPQVTSTATVLDPCELLDSSEAQKLTGHNFGQGVLSTLPGGAKVCTYGANTTNVLMVEVGQAPDVATADAWQASFMSDIQKAVAEFGNIAVQITQISDFGSAAVSATLGPNVLNISGSAFGFRKNTIFFGFSDEVRGALAPSPDAMRAEAAFVLGELP